jgi:hypothetical protein
MARWDNIEILEAVDRHQEPRRGAAVWCEATPVVSILATPGASTALTVPSACQRHSQEHAT